MSGEQLPGLRDVDVLVLGLDLSVKSTGVAMPWGETRTIVPRSMSKEPARRLQEIVYRLDIWLRSSRADVAVLEGYSPGGPGGPWGTLRLGELGGAVRVRLFEHGIPYVEIAPTSLKHFATGNGKASKDDMVAAAQHQGAAVANHDEADAWHLRRLGLAFYAGADLSAAIKSLPWPNLKKEGVPA